MRRKIGLALATMFIIGCSTPSAERSGSATPHQTPPATSTWTSTPTSAPAASAGQAQAATPAPTAVPTPRATARPGPAQQLDIDWTADDPVGLPVVSPSSEVVNVVRTDAGYVLVTERYEDEEFMFTAWWSTDGRTWQRGRDFPLGQRILAMTTGGPGFVLGGTDGQDAIIWTSTDGHTWQAVDDPSLRNGLIRTLITTASGVVAFGRGGDGDGTAIWTSIDGAEWLAATNETGRTVARGLLAVGAYDGRAIAFVSEGDRAPAAIWETTGRAEWTRTGSLPTAETAGWVDVVAGGSRGWIALNGTDTWRSTDGRVWKTVKAGPDVSADVVVDDAGFVAVGWVGSLPGETCGDQRPFEGHTWTSTDGRTWQRMPVSHEFKAAMVTRLLVVDRTLVGYGGRIISDGVDLGVGRWTAPLPDVSRRADASDKGSKRVSCGG